MSDYKKLVNAFHKIGKEWGDSKTNKYTWKYAGFKNSRQWARYMAGSYEINYVLSEISSSINGINSQADFDYFAEEEVSAAYW